MQLSLSPINTVYVINGIKLQGKILNQPVKRIESLLKNFGFMEEVSSLQGMFRYFSPKKRKENKKSTLITIDNNGKVNKIRYVDMA